MNKSDIIIKSHNKNIVKRINIEDEFFQRIFGMGACIAGGYARWACTPFDKRVHKIIEANDIDVFCEKEEYYLNIHKWLESVGKIAYKSDFATSFTLRNSKYSYLDKTIQLIAPRIEGNIILVGTPIDIISNFDFTINMIAITKTEIFMHKNFFRDLSNRKLYFNNIHCPLGILIRLKKYFKKGFNMETSEMLKVFQVWDSLDSKIKTEIQEAFDINYWDSKFEEAKKNNKLENAIDVVMREKRRRISRLMYID